jgi:hypothetical protein
MNKTRILSFEMSQKVNEVDLVQVSAGQVKETQVDRTYSERTCSSDISIDF